MNNESLIGKISVPEVIYEDGPQSVTKSEVEKALFSGVPASTEISDNDQIVVCEEENESKPTVTKRLDINSLRNPVWVCMRDIPDYDGSITPLEVPRAAIVGANDLKLGDEGILIIRYNPSEANPNFSTIDENVSYYYLVYGDIRQLEGRGCSIMPIEVIALPDYKGLSNYFWNSVGNVDKNEQKEMVRQDYMLFQGCLDGCLYKDSISSVKAFMFGKNMMDLSSDHKINKDIVNDVLNNSDAITYEQTSSVPNAGVVVYDPAGNNTYIMSFEELKMKLSTIE